MRVPSAAALAVLLASVAAAASSSPYAGQEAREIKALSPDQVRELLDGAGMGLAKAAELNGYPGPAHVLELAAGLGLTPEQRRKTQALFDAMQARARALGRALVDEEQRLDHLFASRRITPESLRASLARIGELQAQVRSVHLQAHLDQTRILTPEQVARYAELRGYASPSGHGDHGKGRGH